MRKIRIYIVAAALAAFGVLPAVVSPASASHRCGLGNNPVNSICEGAHDIPCIVVPKLCA